MKLKAPAFINSTQQSISKHSPEILTAVGIVGMVTTVVLAVKATPKALESIQAESQKKVDKQLKAGVDPKDVKHELSPVETVKVAWKPYIPAAITGIVSIGCLVGANSVNAKRNAALATACQLSATALSEYQEKVNETVDEETKQIIEDKVIKEKLKKNPVPEKEGLRDQELVLDNHNYLCYDAGGNLYFRSDENSIRAAINTLNRRMNDGEGYVSLNDLYSELNVRGTDVGELLGWNRYREGQIDPVIESQIASNGEPCIVLRYSVAPAYDYYKIEI